MNKNKKVGIFVVDDHQMFLDGMISILTAQQNFEVLVVETSAKNALLKMNDKIPDIVITDISMPEMNGIEFIKILKRQYPSVKILVLSMFENQQTYDGIDGYLLKETNKDILIEAINGIMRNEKKYFNANQNSSNSFEFKKSILTKKEKEIIQLIAQENTTEEIAKKLFISKGTIESHRKNIFLKLQVTNVAGLVKKAVYLGVVK
jgi:DNA-binding NarL/FixJ family response regulator